MVALEQGCLVVVLATPAGHGEGVKRAKQNRPAGADWSRGRWRATPVCWPRRASSHGPMGAYTCMWAWAAGGRRGRAGGRRAHAEGAGTRVLFHVSKAGLKWPSSSRAAGCSNSAQRYPGIPGEASRILRVRQTGTQVALEVHNPQYENVAEYRKRACSGHTKPF